MIADDLTNKICMLLNENNVSTETTICIMKLLIADKFKNLDDMHNKYAKALHYIKIILEDDA